MVLIKRIMQRYNQVMTQNGARLHQPRSEHLFQALQKAREVFINPVYIKWPDPEPVGPKGQIPSAWVVCRGLWPSLRKVLRNQVVVGN